MRASSASSSARIRRRLATATASSDAGGGGLGGLGGRRGNAARAVYGDVHVRGRGRDDGVVDAGLRGRAVGGVASRGGELALEFRAERRLHASRGWTPRRRRPGPRPRAPPPRRREGRRFPPSRRNDARPRPRVRSRRPPRIGRPRRNARRIREAPCAASSRQPPRDSSSSRDCATASASRSAPGRPVGPNAPSIDAETGAVARAVRNASTIATTSIFLSRENISYRNCVGVRRVVISGNPTLTVPGYGV